MVVVLIGYPGSQKIRKASEYLTAKYLPGFEVVYLNYEGDTAGWSAFVAAYLQTLPDEKIIFALDDYLLNAPLDKDLFAYALSLDAINVKLCQCSAEEQLAYPVTTQYTLWNRQELIKLLEQTTTPWDFEITGSTLLRNRTAQCAALTYYTNSALSTRWEGVDLTGLSEADVKVVQSLI